MGFKKSASSLATTSLAVATLTGLCLAPAVHNTATTLPPQILRGMLHRPGGEALDGADVQVSVTLNQGSESIETPIASATSGPNGSFIVRGKLGHAPVSYNPDGTIQLQVDVAAPGLSKTYFVNAQPPAAGRADWTWGDLADEDVMRPGSAGLARAAAATANGLAQAEAHKPMDGIDLTAVPVSRMAQNSNLGLASSGGCVYTAWHTESSSYDTSRNIPVQHITVQNRTLQDYRWYTTKETQMGIAVDEDIKTEGGTYSAGSPTRRARPRRARWTRHSMPSTGTGTSTPTGATDVSACSAPSRLATTTRHRCLASMRRR